MTKVAILQADEVDQSLQSRFGDVDGMMETMLERAFPNHFEFATFRVDKGCFPQEINLFDAYLITGSKSGVYEDLPWIPQLMRFIGQAFESGTKLLGICFGHQAIAQALGGRVEKYQGGWGVGLHTYQSMAGNVEILDSQPTYQLLACHQDQVTEIPPAARVSLTSDFCVNAGIQIDQQVLTVQPHPEFSTHYLECVLRAMEHKLGDLFQPAVNSLLQENDSLLLGKQLAAFLTEEVDSHAASL